MCHVLFCAMDLLAPHCVVWCVVLVALCCVVLCLWCVVVRMLDFGQPDFGQFDFGWLTEVEIGRGRTDCVCSFSVFSSFSSSYLYPAHHSIGPGPLCPGPLPVGLPSAGPPKKFALVFPSHATIFILFCASLGSSR